MGEIYDVRTRMKGGIMQINKDDAIKDARKAIADTFVVTVVGSFYDEKEEEETTIKLVGEGPSDGPIIPQPGDDEAGVYYVTMGFDSVEGDGHFRATARVTAEGARVVDFEALP